MTKTIPFTPKELLALEQSLVTLMRADVRTSDLQPMTLARALGLTLDKTMLLLHACHERGTIEMIGSGPARQMRLPGGEWHRSTAMIKRGQQIEKIRGLKEVVPDFRGQDVALKTSRRRPIQAPTAEPALTPRLSSLGDI